MHIGLLNEWVMFQKNTPKKDAIGNHYSEWQDYFGCFATIGGEYDYDKERDVASQIVDESVMTVTVRYCRALSRVKTLDYRLIFHDELYDIVSVDHMNFKKKSLKFFCRKARRT